MYSTILSIKSKTHQIDGFRTSSVKWSGFKKFRQIVTQSNKSIYISEIITMMYKELV